MPPDNEAISVLKCFFCEDDVYQGDEYYVLNGFYCCEACLDIHFKFTAELPDYDSQCHAAGAEAAVLTNRKKYRAVQAASDLAEHVALPIECDFLFICTRKSLCVSFELHESEQCYNISARATEKAEREYEDLKIRGEI